MGKKNVHIINKIKFIIDVKENSEVIAIAYFYQLVLVFLSFVNFMSNSISTFIIVKYEISI